MREGGLSDDAASFGRASQLHLNPVKLPRRSTKCVGGLSHEMRSSKLAPQQLLQQIRSSLSIF